MPEYSELKGELQEIAGIVAKFPDSIQPKVFDVLIEHFLGGQTSMTTKKPHTTAVSEKATPVTDTTPIKRRQASGKEALSIVKDLDLREKNDIPSFRAIYQEKKPRSSREFNTVAIYYLQQILGLTGITPDHVYTCYREVKHKPPMAFYQSIWDTASKTGTIDSARIQDLKVSHRGIVFVEHDLPKEQKEKGK